jgi:predicted phosphodiesterase
MAITFLTNEDKAELLSKINEAASSGDGLERVIVDMLPSTGIKVDTVYLIPTSESESSNRYNEYIFIPNKGTTATEDGTYSDVDGVWEVFGGGSGDVDLTEINNRIDKLSEAIAEQGKTIPKVFDWANAELPFTESEISGTINGAGFVVNPENFADGKTYFRYHAGATNFTWKNPNPQKGSLTITVRAYAQWSTSLSTKLVTEYTDGTNNSLDDTMRLSHGETVTYTTDPDKTVAYIRGNYDLENWVLLDMSVLSIVADYPAPTGKVKSVNGVEPDENGNVEIAIPEGGGGSGGGIANETDPTVPDWAKQPEKPKYTASEVGALPDTTKIPASTSDLANDSGYITIAVATLLNYYLKTETYAKTETYSQTEVDNLISGLDKRLNAIADSEDVDLDQLSEIVAYIKSNKSLIDAITTNKVNVSDIVDNLTTADSKKPLSAAQGKALKAMYDALPAWAKAANKPTYNKSEVGLGNVDNVRQYSESNPPPYPVTSVNGQTGGVTVTAAGIGAATTGQVEELAEAIADLRGDTIPWYWDTGAPDEGQPANYLTGKINDIKALHRKYGKDCFSFVLMADIHYAQNLGKRSPLIAKKIMDESEIKIAICAGDVQNRECMSTKEEVLAENVLIEEMFEPLKNRVLFEQGNHDGSYGVVNGVYYAKNLTPQEMHEFLFRKVGMVGDVHFDDTGTAYYIDDVSNNVRYIGLNTQCNEYVPQKDNPDKYPNMTHFRFTQPQFDFLTKEALVTGLTKNSKVVVFGHCPLWQEIGDADVMISVLNAYKDKGKVENAVYEGTASGGASYVNLAEPMPDNTADTTKWINGYRISSSGLTNSSGAGKTTSNPIPIEAGDVIRVKGVNFVSGVDRVGLFGADGVAMAEVSYVSDLPAGKLGYSLVDDVHTFTILATDANTATFRCEFNTPADPSSVIITKNEEIVESEHGYDYVVVNADFTEAKGELIGYFAGHNHYDISTVNKGFLVNATRSDSPWENGPDKEALRAERVKDTITEQSFSVFTVTPGKVYETKIGAGADRIIEYPESVLEKS